MDEKEIIEYVEPYSEKWHQLNYRLLRETCPTSSCSNCGYPVIVGYCCTFCYIDNYHRNTKTVVNKLKSLEK